MSSTGHHWECQAAPGFCVHCLVKPARPNPQHPHIPTLFCSERHRKAYYSARELVAKRAGAERIRQLLGLPMGRGKDFTIPELEAIVRRLERVLPYDGQVMYPAGHRGRGKRQAPRPRGVAS